MGQSLPTAASAASQNPPEERLHCAALPLVKVTYPNMKMEAMTGHMKSTCSVTGEQHYGSCGLEARWRAGKAKIDPQQQAWHVANMSLDEAAGGQVIERLIGRVPSLKSQ